MVAGNRSIAAMPTNLLLPLESNYAHMTARRLLRKCFRRKRWLLGNRGVRRSLSNAVQYALAGCHPH